MSASRAILVVEDEPAIRAGICDLLAYHGHRPIGVGDGPRGLELALAEDHALVILDVMLPGLDGFEICTRLRAAKPGQAILMLTARGREGDVLRGFECGCDDYVAKPFSIAVLRVRVEALLRRVRGPDEPASESSADEPREPAWEPREPAWESSSGGPQELREPAWESSSGGGAEPRSPAWELRRPAWESSSGVAGAAQKPAWESSEALKDAASGAASDPRRLVLGPLALDLDNLRASVGTQQIDLTSRDLDVLVYLARQRHRVVSRLDLLREVWGYERAEKLETRCVDMHVVKLRRRLAELLPESDSPIETVRGVGYRLRVPEGTT